MDFHLCKSRRGSNPDVLNCANPAGTNPPGKGGVTPERQKKGGTADPNPVTNHGSPFSLNICPTTGGLVQLDMPAHETVDGLRKAVSKKLGVAQDRISLLYREKVLRDGSLIENQLSDGCRITLLPKVESGLMSRQPELSVMQALENLSDSQVNDFLTGRSPLTLAMRLGNHMMFLQLQLSSVSHGGNKRAHGQPSPTTHPTTRGRHPYHPGPPVVAAPSRTTLNPSRDQQQKQQHRMGGHMMIPKSDTHAGLVPPPSIITPPPSPKSPTTSSPSCTTPTSPSPYTYPVTSLPMNSSHLTVPANDIVVDPANTPPSSPCYVHKPIPLVNRDVATPNCTTPSPTHLRVSQRTTVCGSHRNIANDNQKYNQSNRVPFLDKSTLAEAKRSLSMKLKEFSEQASQEIPKDTQAPGAVIETMQRLGHGVYSGTFSGTLNPALQDPDGKPRRSINTIVHILNDLLGASPTRAAAAAAALRSGHAQTERPGDTTGVKQRQAAPVNVKPEAHRSQQQQTADDGEDAECIRGKVEQIQLMLDERRRKRQARRHARSAPYLPRCPSGEVMTSHDGNNDTEGIDQQPIQMQKGFD